MVNPNLKFSTVAAELNLVAYEFQFVFTCLKDRRNK